MNYKINSAFNRNLGFQVNHVDVLNSVTALNTFLRSLPPNLYRSIDFKTIGALIGAVFCTKIIENVNGAVVNPIEKGHPDIIPFVGLGSSEELLRNYPEGLEIKGTIGNLRTGANLRAGQTRINELSGLTWQAHHREVNYPLGIVWDFVNNHEDFNYPAITGAFFSDELETEDWEKSQVQQAGIQKLQECAKVEKIKWEGDGWILLYNNDNHLTKYCRLMGIDRDSVE